MSPVPVQGDLQGRVAPILLQNTVGILKRIGQEQELASSEPPDIELAEILELTVDLALADPRPPPDRENEHRRADTGVIWARKVNFRNPSSNEIHLVHIRRQHIEVLREGGFIDRNTAMYPLQEQVCHFQKN